MSAEKIPHEDAETAYRARVPLPTEIREFIEAFQGMGNLRIDSGEAYFEFWAKDLWDAARICHDVEREVNPNQPVVEPMRIERPVEVFPVG